MTADSGAVSDDHRTVSQWSKYDLLLAILPLPLLIGGLWGLLHPMPYQLGLGAGGVPSIAMLGYALFIEAPV